ncbi:MAG TPA: Na+/H+ antiporter NhaA [Candidatus Acidoferrales bacterium]|nr:Na+/H+ antiporter NhaA [Candidatus Acidoferrales bacterium]
MVTVQRFFKQETAGGYVLIAASLLGLIWANSPIAGVYHDLLHAKIGIVSEVYTIKLTTHEWVNDALMTVFFFLIGLEMKYAVLRGQLSSVAKAALPAIAAVGGMIVPAAICFALVSHEPARVQGWAIPAATDIAFALAALGMLGPSVPQSLKVFLTALAVIDDLGAIVIIAVFYTPNIVWAALIAALVGIALLVLMNRLGVVATAPYVVLGLLVWVCVFESGVHATLAGVTVAFTIPMASLPKIEHALSPWVAFLIVPLFGLFNAGISFAGLTPAVLLAPLPLGIAAGLFVGKQVGIFGFSWIATRVAKIQRPDGVTWPMLYGAAVLGGIGFTMSLFIGTLAFTSEDALTETKIGVLLGSFLSAIAGYFVLRAATRSTGNRKPSTG